MADLVPLLEWLRESRVCSRRHGGGTAGLKKEKVSQIGVRQSGGPCISSNEGHGLSSHAAEVAGAAESHAFTRRLYADQQRGGL